MMTKVFIDFWLRTEVSKPDFALELFVKTLLLYSGINILITTLRAYTFTFISMRATYNLFKNLNNKIMYAKLVFFDRTPIG